MSDEPAQDGSRSWFEERDPVPPPAPADPDPGSDGDTVEHPVGGATGEPPTIEARMPEPRTTVDEPAAEPPNAEPSNAEPPNAEPPTVEAPRVTSPSVNAPSAEPPTVEAPTVPAPSAERGPIDAPTVSLDANAARPGPAGPDAEGPDAPGAEGSDADAPGAEASAAEGSGADGPRPDDPGLDGPGADDSDTVAAAVPEPPVASRAEHGPGPDSAAETTAIIPALRRTDEPDVSMAPGYRPAAAPAQQPPMAAPAPADDPAVTTEIPRYVDESPPAGRAGEGPADRDHHDHHVGPPPGIPAAGGATGGGDRARLLRRGGLVAAAVLGLLVLLYGADLLLSRGEVPRGVTVAGVPVGGLDRASAEQELREQIEPRLGRPVALRAGDVDTEIDPAAAGLTLNWSGTLDQAGEQPLNPWTRLTSLFTSREVGVVTAADRDVLTTTLEGLRPQTDREPAEGTIRFEGVTPIVVEPRGGQTLDVQGATDAVLADWAGGQRVALPVATAPVRTTSEGIRRTLTEVVEPAVAAPVTITGEGAEAVLAPEVTAAALRFAPADGGGLDTTIDNPIVIGALAPQLAGTEQPGQDAQVVIEGGRPTVLPSTDGRGVDWEASLVPLLDALRRDEDRTLPAVYAMKPALLTTEQANQLGITEVIGEFQTGGFATDSGQNIRRAAEQINGTIVRPGDTFSLNGTTGPRNASTGYVQAGIIDDGRPARGIGGGVSQIATTIYNASYFAGMVDVEHQEHSYYISRYPEGREATVFEGSIDVRFQNDAETGVLIQTAWTPSSITVTIWGTKRYDVESITGERTDFTSPQTRTIPAGESCSSSSGSEGFTVTDTRVLRDAGTGAEVDRQSRQVVYNPQPRIVCAPEPQSAPAADPGDAEPPAAGG